MFMMDNGNCNIVITIGRQFGSGGREFGKLLSESLGIAYYDKELLCEAAKSAGVNLKFFERSDEKCPSFLSGVFPFAVGYTPMVGYVEPTSISDDGIYRAQSDFIRSIADNKSCVIVGRSADYILRDHPRCINIFVHAPIEECVKRILSRGDKTDDEQARAMAEKTNKLRSHYYNFYTDKTWGDARSYDFTFDSSKLPMMKMVEVVKEYIKHRFGVEFSKT